MRLPFRPEITTARLVRHVRSITVCEVGVAGTDEEEFARALVTYKVDG